MKTSASLAHFDEHGLFELTSELAQQVGGALPQPPPLVKNLQKRIHDTLNDPDGNRVCVPNGACGLNIPCLP